MESSSYDDPQSKIWSIYISEADKVDKALAASWKGDMDGILIFVRLLVKLLSYNNRLTNGSSFRQVFSPPA